MKPTYWPLEGRAMSVSDGLERSSLLINHQNKIKNE